MGYSKKQQILDSALRLFVHQGIQATSTASIAKEANVATGTLFHHFPSKQSLVLCLYSSIKSELGEAMQQCPHQQAPRQQVRHYWQQALQWAQANPEKLRFLLHIAHDPQFYTSQHQELMVATMNFLVEQIKQAQHQQLLAPLPLDLVLNFCHNHYLACANLFIEQPDLAHQRSYQDGAFQILWQGLSPVKS
ncbi:TetR/AcrR family transcriptional regulator [uncultured Photobacterium sp.]|uniref:TetR/AcrR family transcriptional regulator n=1 Tax=uncultured Photobacterium sp. TaxID=173973 RepID=UPI002608BE9E|nr:TetR/AcrR family transcriptional regulator [uncultured Photobacterium sp.]